MRVRSSVRSRHKLSTFSVIIPALNEEATSAPCSPTSPRRPGCQTRCSSWTRAPKTTPSRWRGGSASRGCSMASDPSPAGGTWEAGARGCPRLSRHRYPPARTVLRELSRGVRRAKPRHRLSAILPLPLHAGDRGLPRALQLLTRAFEGTLLRARGIASRSGVRSSWRAAGSIPPQVRRHRVDPAPREAAGASASWRSGSSSPTGATKRRAPRA